MQLLTPIFVGTTITRVVREGNPPTTYNELRSEASKLGFLALVNNLTFGEPESVSRVGNHFTARAKAPAKKTRFPVTIFAEKEVTFDLDYDENELRVRNLSGVRMKFPLMNAFDLRDVTFTIDRNGDIFAVTSALPKRVRLDEEGIHLF
jgi:hypothetical protein